MPPQGLVVADDATGAIECASLLAGLHLDVSINLSDTAASTPLSVVDAESRHLAPAQAAARMRHWLADAPERVFKKTDSTLRGNIAAELTAMLQARPTSPLVYIPAYPALGRTVVDGRLLVHGVPLADTEFAADPRQPARSSVIADLFPPEALKRISNASALAEALHSHTAKILVCDAASTADMAALSAVLAGETARPWIASPAGFIEAWAAMDDYPRRTPPALPSPANWLILCGSLHPQSRRQATAAAARGWDVLQTATDRKRPPGEIAKEFAATAAQRIAERGPDAVIVMGGDTVRALWREMGITELIPLPELLNGIAACVTIARDRLFVTKAGGFGDDSLVEQILKKCK